MLDSQSCLCPETGAAEDAHSAADRRHLLHGVGRALWHRRHSRRRRFAGHRHSAGAAVSLEPAHRADDRRAGQRHSGRRRLLHLGAPRDWGPSGATRRAGSRSRPASSTWRSIQPSSCSTSANSAPRSPRAGAATRGRWRWSALCCAWNLRGAPAVGEDSVWLFALLLAPFAVFVVLGIWHGLTLHPAMQWGRTAQPATRGPFHCGAGGDVELHGLGQRLHRGAGGRRIRSATIRAP